MNHTSISIIFDSKKKSVTRSKFESNNFERYQDAKKGEIFGSSFGTEVSLFTTSNEGKEGNRPASRLARDVNGFIRIQGETLSADVHTR